MPWIQSASMRYDHGPEEATPLGRIISLSLAYFNGLARTKGSESMDYYESVVVNYLRADRTLFLNTECCVQLKQSDNPDSTDRFRIGPHWICDAVACDFRKRYIFLCEISYGARLVDLIKRLTAWHENWDLVCQALVRDSYLPKDFRVRPWLFVPTEKVPLLKKWRAAISSSGQAPKFVPLVTTLDMVQPWRYSSWNRIGENAKPEIPEEMRT